MYASVSGQYQAKPKQWTVGPTKNGAIELTVDFHLTGWFDGENWLVTDAEIIGRFYLVTKDGTINTKTVETVEDVFGWNQADGTEWFAHIQELPACQVSCEFEEYNGKNTLKVKWLNAFDRDPNHGLKPINVTECKKIDGQFGNLFRANARKPATPKTSARPSPTNPAQAEMKMAWETFQKTFPDLPKEAIAIEWKQAMREFKPTPPQTWLATDWTRFVADNFIKVVENPIEQEAVFSSEDVPF